MRDMATKTIAEIVAATGVSRFTVHSAVTNGMLQAVSRQSGKTWIINTDTEEYRAWLRRPEQAQKGKGKPRGQGKAK